MSIRRVIRTERFVFMISNAKDKTHRTIEDELVEAFVKVGAIPQAHADDMSKVCFTSVSNINDENLSFKKKLREDDNKEYKKRRKKIRI